jgi:hypothetical protein
MKPPCVIAVLFSAVGLAAQGPAAGTTVSYAGGQLSIDAHDSTLADILMKVGAITGVKIDIPAGAASERMVVVKMGPGPARQVLASLLSESSFDYLIEGSDADPEAIHSVLLIAKEKKGGKANAMEAAGLLSRSPYVRTSAAASEGPEAPGMAEPEQVAVEASPAQPATSTPQEPPAVPLPPERASFTRPGALSPPDTMSPQAINQQLTQMYQQRMQMMRQDPARGTAPVPAASNPGDGRP